MKIYLAPMEGVVDHHMRKLYSHIGGIDLCVTEFVRVTDTRLPEKVFKLACPELLNPIAVPVKVQLLGSNPKALAYNAAKVAHMGAPAVDLNFGCPAKSVNKNRGGACLLEEPKLIGQIVGAVRAAVPEATPVTAKIRLGYHQRTGYVDVAKAIEDAGANELVVHARSKVDGYRPPAYWSLIQTLRSHVQLPIVANGEIWSPEDYLQCASESGCTNVMLGRGLMARPDLALAIKSQHTKQPYTPYSWSKILPLLYQFHQQTVDAYPKKYCGNRLKQWLMYLKLTYHEAETFFNAVKKSRCPKEIESLFETFFAQIP